MIQPTALPAAANPLLALDVQTAPPAEAGGTVAPAAPFAGFLAEKLGLGRAGSEADAPEPAAPAPPANPVAALRAALGRALGAVSDPANGKDPGKPGGKDLPDLPQAGAKHLSAQGEDQTTDDAAAALPASLATALGAAVPAEASPVVQTPQSAPAPVSPDGAAIATLPAAAPQEREVPVSGGISARARPVSLPVSVRPGIQPGAPAALHRREPDARPLLEQAATALPDPVTAATITADRLARPAIALRTLAQLSEALAKAAPAAASLSPLASQATVAAASPGIQPDAVPAGLLPGQAIPARLAFAGQPARLKSLDRPDEAEPAEATAAAPEAAPTASGKTPAPETASPLPAAQPFSAWSAAETAPSPAAAAAAGPVTPAAQPRDFAGLIDRLVEAREAAQASLSPQTVQAALSHTDFGKVSLQFQQDAGGMTVAMTSTDPDFSRAVQTAAPAAQMPGDTGTPQRQDSSGQSAASASFAQSQSQQRGQSSARDSADPRPAANPAPARRDGHEPAARGGIFA